MCWNWEYGTHRIAGDSFVVHASGTPETHPVYELLLDAAIEDSSRAASKGLRRLLARRCPGRRRTENRVGAGKAKDRSDIGRFSEELIDGYFAIEKDGGHICDFEWV